MSLVSDLTEIKERIDELAEYKVARFAYNDTAYANDDYEGKATYDYEDDNTIPTATGTVIKATDTVLDKGFRTQAASIPRMLINHFFGRVSYNLNKVVDFFSSALDKIMDSLGAANGIAPLDENTKVPNVNLHVNEVNGIAPLDANGFLPSANSYARSFTYVVNSDASLAYWLSNKQSGTSSGGADFTSVLIKKGTWNFTGTTVALDTIGTIYVEGEAGSKLVTSYPTKSVLRYSSLNTAVGSAMYNVSVENDSVSDCVGFHYCRNLTNCTSYVSGHSANYGYSSCFNLTNCTGTCTLDGAEGAGFNGCSNLTNCIGTGTGRDNVYGFEDCSNLTNCVGTGVGTNGALSLGVGFSSCKVVHGCKAGGHCTRYVFQNSYASHSETATYAVADTANGGFNDTTNPSA